MRTYQSRRWIGGCEGLVVVEDCGCEGSNSHWIVFGFLTCWDACEDCTFLNTTLSGYGENITVYDAESPCDVCTTGSVHCNNGVLTGDTSFQFTDCVPITCGGSSGDPHFYGFKGQKVTHRTSDPYLFSTTLWDRATKSTR